MNDSSVDTAVLPLAQSQDALGEILREGAQRLLVQAIEAEVAGWIDAHAHIRDQAGHRHVVRNGHLPGRTILTGVGPVEVEQPRVHDRRPKAEAEKFTSKILPPYLRKTKSIEELIPWLYLKGISTGDFHEALAALLGPQAPGLSATTVTRLKTIWEDEYKTWNQRALEGKHYVYLWADGVYFNVRLEEDRQCLLVLMGATPDGKKELIAVAAGHRESEQSWLALLLDCKARGMKVDPLLATGDGALGFWKALPQVWSTTFTWPRPEPKRRMRSISSWRHWEPSTAKRRNVWPKTAPSCWLSTTSQPNTGCIFARRIQLSRSLRRFGCGCIGPRAVVRL